MAQPRTRQPFTCSPFAPLQLSLDDEETLEQLSRVVLRNYVTQYERFENASRSRVSNGIEPSQRTIDERVWKPVKQLDNVRAFVQRKARRQRRSSRARFGINTHSYDDNDYDRYDDNDDASSVRDTIASYANSGVVTPAELPEMLIVGSVPGALEDVMLGLMSPDVAAVRVRTAYIDDNIIDAAILKTFALPSVEEPFTSFVIKWVHNDTSHGYLRAVVSDRDFVYFERTGIVTTSSGERLGFHLLHSVHFPQTHELPGLVRGNTSICGLYRTNPTAPHEVELYVRTIIDAGGSIVRPVVVLSAADAHVAVAKFIECAARKKLAWQLRLSRRNRLRSVTRSSSSSATSGSSSIRSDGRSKCGSVDVSPPPPPGTCAICNKPTSRTMDLLRRPRTCVLCENPICSTCRVKASLSQVNPFTNRLEQRKFAFCCVCFGATRSSSALVVAQQVAAARDTQGFSIAALSAWSDSRASSSISSG